MWTPNINNKEIQFPCACEIKIDGEFVYWNGQYLVNKRGIDKTTISILPEGVQLYGELYFGEGKNFYSEIHSHQGINNKVIIFDNDQYGIMYYEARRTLLEQQAKQHHFDIIPSKICNNIDELESYFKQITDQGFEGIVVKPLKSKTDLTWVKLKKEFTDTLLIRSIRKGKKAVGIGNAKNIFGSCATTGWELLLNLIEQEGQEKGDKYFIGENKDHYFIDSNIKVEVKHNGLIGEKKLRFPRIKRIRDFKSEVSL